MPPLSPTRSVGHVPRPLLLYPPVGGGWAAKPDGVAAQPDPKAPPPTAYADSGGGAGLASRSGGVQEDVSEHLRALLGHFDFALQPNDFAVVVAGIKGSGSRP